MERGARDDGDDGGSDESDAANAHVFVEWQVWMGARANGGRIALVVKLTGRRPPRTRVLQQGIAPKPALCESSPVSVLKFAVILSERSESKDLHLPPGADVQMLISTGRRNSVQPLVVATAVRASTCSSHGTRARGPRNKERTTEGAEDAEDNRSNPE